MTFFQGQSEDQLLPVMGPGQANDQDLGRRIKLVQDAAPIFAQGDGVQYAMQMASAPWDDNELVRQAQAAGGQALVTAYQSHLTSIEDPWKQLQAYNQFDAGQKRLLEKAGYVPPVARDPGPKGLGIITHTLATSLGGVAKLAKNLPGPNPLQGLENLAGLGTNLYRATRLGVEEEGFFGIGGSLGDAEVAERRRSAGAVLSDLKSLWQRTGDGESNFTIKSQERVKRSIQETDRFNFVMNLAEGKDAYTYLSEDLGLDPNTPLFETEIQRYSQYQMQDDVQEAVKDLRNNKVSPGRDFADAFTPFTKGSTPFNWVSGGLDATFRIVTDPTLAAGKVVKGYRLAQYGLSPRLLEMGGQAVEYANRIDHLATLPKFARAADEIALAFRSGGESHLMDLIPQMRGGGVESFRNYLNESAIALEDVQASHVFDYYKSELGTAALKAGKFAAPHFPGTILPSLGAQEIEVLGRTVGIPTKAKFALGTKQWVGQFRLEDFGFDALDPEQLKSLFGLRGKAAIDLRQGVGDAIHSFYTKVPKYNVMGPDSDHSLETFKGMLDYSLPGFLRDEFVSDFVKTTDWATRRAVYESGVEAMFHYSGALATDEGAKLLRRALRKGQTYATEGIDLLDGQPTAIGEADLADGWAIPDFKEMLAMTKETTKFRRILDHTDNGLINRFFANYWKPAVLLKAGFIPRAYGEEYLGFILREGPKAWFKSQAAITATKDGYLLPLRPVGWIADSLLSHIPLTIRDKPLEIYAHNMMSSTTDFVRGWAGKLGPNKYLTGARALAEYGGIDAATAQLGTSLGAVTERLPNRLRAETIGRIDQETGEISQVPIKHGEFTTHEKGSAFHAHAVLLEMRRMQSDRMFSGLIDAGRRQIGREEGEQIISQFADAGLIEPRSQSYSRNLVQLRNQMPNKVLPKFEAMLQHDSYASFDSVVGELIDSGMDADTAQRFVSNVKSLNPRQRVALFTRDGELERLYQPQTLDPDAAFNYESDLPFIRQEVEDLSTKEYHEILEDLWSESPSTEAYRKITRTRLNAGDMQDTVRKSYRSRKTLDNRVVAEPPAKGSRRVYTVVVDQNPVSLFEDLGQAEVISSSKALESGTPQLARQNPLLDMENGYLPVQSQEVHSLIPDHQPNLNTVEVGAGEAATPEEMAWFTQDYAHAQHMQEGLSSKYKTQGVSIGYVDVPEDVFQKGRNLAKENAAGGLDPLALQNQANQVWIPKTWRENYQVLGQDNFQMVSPELEAARETVQNLQIKISRDVSNSNSFVKPADREALDRAKAELAELEAREAELAKVPAVGAARHEAIDDWALVVGQRYQQVFEAMDPHSLRDLQHDLLENRIDVKQVANHTQYLNDGAIGPAALEPGHENWFKKITQQGFDLVGKGGNAMIRNQMFLHYYTERLASETRTMARLLGETGATRTIDEFADRLGAQHYELVSDWKALPEDVRLAANPYEAMIARDPVPPSLRQVVDVEDQKIFAEAWTAMYEYDNTDLMEDAEKLWNDKYVKTGLVDEYTFKNLQDSYISLDYDLRQSIAKNGYPPQIPASFEKAGAPRFAPERIAQPIAIPEPLLPDALPDNRTFASPNFNLPDEAKQAHFDYTASLERDVRRPAQAKFAEWAATNPEYQAEVQRALADLPEEFVVYRGDAGTVLGGEYSNATLRADFAEPYSRAKWGAEAGGTGAEGKVQAYVVRKEDVVAIGAAGQWEVLLKTDALHSIDEAAARAIPSTVAEAVTGGLDADDWTRLREALDTNRHIYKTAHDTAMKAAINDTIPWIDDYRVRSQFQQHGRNLIPFWFSQENFIRRVANNVLRDPAAIRKAQVMMNAFHNSGIVTQNQFGEDVYNIPLTGTVVKAATKLMEILPGDGKWTLPVVNAMTGQVKHTIPGLDTFDRIGPSLSPLGAIPLQAVTKLFPELEGAKSAILGERGMSNDVGWKSIMKALVPSYAYKIMEAVTMDPASDSEYASAMIQTQQMLEASGHGLPADADPYEFDDHQDRLENFTRMQMFMRGILGFFSPAAPSTVPVEEFTPEFSKLMRQMPLEDAFLQFMAENPNAQAYTIMKTEVKSKAPLSASQAAGKVLDENQDYFHKYQMAGPWLLPQSDDDTGFSMNVYNTQIARELRRRKTFKEWQDDYYFAAAATDYFDTKEAYDLRMAGAKGNPGLRRQMTESYQVWKQDYLDKHKIFARLLLDPTAQQRRSEVLSEAKAALSDPAAPDAAHKDALVDLVDTYQAYLERRNQYKRNTNAEMQLKQNVKDQFVVWVKPYVDQNPGVKAFYERIIRPELGVD